MHIYLAGLIIIAMARAAGDCPAAATTAVATRELASLDWGALTAERVRQLWLRQGQEQDQGAEDGVVRYRWRVAGGVCECCDEFVFWSAGDLSGQQGLELAIFRRTEPTYAGALALARLILAAAGVPADEWKGDFLTAPDPRPRPLVRAYSWDVERPRAEIDSVNMEVRKAGKSWMLYCAIRREAKHR